MLAVLILIILAVLGADKIRYQMKMQHLKASCKQAAKALALYVESVEKTKSELKKLQARNAAK